MRTNYRDESDESTGRCCHVLDRARPCLLAFGRGFPRYGGAGFVGSHVRERLLHSGHAVWAFDDLNPFYDTRIKQRNLRDIQALARPFEFIRGDLTDRAAVDG